MTHGSRKELSRIDAEGKSQEEILHLMWEKGFSIIEAIISIRSLCGVGLGEAKVIVSSNKYWSKIHQESEPLHQAMEQLADVLIRVNNIERMGVGSVNLIAPYKYSGMWVFDDPEVGLLREPFVGGADTIIDQLVVGIPCAESGFAMIFCDGPFPGYDVHLKWVRADGDGNRYYSERLDREGWLCPALLKYFEHPPRDLFIELRPL